MIEKKNQWEPLLSTVQFILTSVWFIKAHLTEILVLWFQKKKKRFEIPSEWDIIPVKYVFLYT